MNPVLDTVFAVIASILLIGGALWALIAAIAMFRVRDAYSRISVFSPATGLGLPMLVTGVFVEFCRAGSFDLMLLLSTVLTVVAMVCVASVASNVLARSAYLSDAPIDPRTDPQELAEEPAVTLPGWSETSAGRRPTEG